MPRFTIGIPTYNRANFLRRSLACAVDQSYPDLEIIVSDNASTDETPEVVKSFGDRVRYHRNAENVGMWKNFLQLPGMASGEYFGWLQDDDLLHRDFARRAVEACDSDKEISMYTAFSIDSHSYDTFVQPLILGPPIPVDWMNSTLRVIEGSVVLPISFFLTFSMPPVTAYRTEIIGEALRGINPEAVLFNERIIQSKAVDHRKIAVDPWTAGLFYKHPNQGSRLAGSCDLPERSRQWVMMANEVSLMLEGRDVDEWSPQLDAWLKGVSSHDMMTIYRELAPAGYWSNLRPLALEICSRILEYLPHEIRQDHREILAKVRNPKKVIKNLGRQLTPPLVWSFLKKNMASS